MKVVFVTRGFGDYIIGLLSALVDRIEVHLVLTRGDEWIAEYVDERVNVFKTNAPRVNSVGNIGSFVRLCRYIGKVKPDIIHLQSGIIWELGLFRVFSKIPFVVTIHDVVKHPMAGRLRFFPQQFIDYLVGKASGIIVHGDSLRELLERRFGDSLGNKTTIRSIEHGIILRYGTGEGSGIPRHCGVLLFGTIDQWKGVEYLVECESMVREVVPDAKFIVAGNSPNPSHYEGLVKSGQNIVMRLTRQEDAEVSSLFRWADVLVLPYIEASQSGVLQLGNAFGVPPVVTSVGGLPDAIRHGENGLIVPPRNSSALAAAIIELLTNRELRQRIVNNIKQERETRFGWHNIAVKTLQLYEEVLSEEVEDR